MYKKSLKSNSQFANICIYSYYNKVYSEISVDCGI